MHAYCCGCAPAPFIANESLSLKRNPESLSVCFCVEIDRWGGRVLVFGGRRFLVDILALVAVAIGQIFGFQRGLEGFGFGPVLVDLWVICFAYLLRVFACRINCK